MVSFSRDDDVGVRCDEVVSSGVFNKCVIGVEVFRQEDTPLTGGLFMVSEVSDGSKFRAIALSDPSNAAVKAGSILPDHACGVWLSCPIVLSEIPKHNIAMKSLMPEHDLTASATVEHLAYLSCEVHTVSFD